MKIAAILSMIFLTLSLSGQISANKASSSGISSSETLRQDLIAGKTQIDQVIADWQKEKLKRVTDKLIDPGVKVSSGNNPFDIVRKELNKVFLNLTQKQTDFFAVYVLGSVFSSDNIIPDWTQTTLQKQQQLIQMLSNVSKMINDEDQGSIRKIGCSGSECDDTD